MNVEVLSVPVTMEVPLIAAPSDHPICNSIHRVPDNPSPTTSQGLPAGWLLHRLCWSVRVPAGTLLPTKSTVTGRFMTSISHHGVY
jgi:hypothetical protein